MSGQIFALFFKIGLFVLMNFKRFLKKHILDSSFLSSICVPNIFSQSVVCFIFLVSIEDQKFLIFDEVQVSIFLL